jgi:signal peptidase I
MPDAEPRQDADRRTGAPLWQEFPILVVVALVLALLLKTFLVQAFYIPSASMENTLQGGNPNCSECGTSPGHPFARVLVNKLAYDFSSPRRGDIVVFKGPPRWPIEAQFTTPSNPIARVLHDVGAVVGLAPSSSNDFVKRVIGVGGDTIRCRDDVLSVNGHVLNEPFLYPGSHPCSSDGFEGKTVTVPKGDLFVMGDHRNDSEDSRVNGPVPVSDVIGRAFVVIWPVSQWKTLPIPATFKQPGLAAPGSHTTLVALIIVVILLVGIVVVAVVRRRHRGRATYAARDG